MAAREREIERREREEKKTKQIRSKNDKKPKQLLSLSLSRLLTLFVVRKIIKRIVVQKLIQNPSVSCHIIDEDSQEIDHHQSVNQIEKMRKRRVDENSLVT